MRTTASTPQPLVEPYDRGTYLVRSSRDPQVAYVVDLEEETCTCDHGIHLREGVRPSCWHFAAARREAVRVSQFAKGD